MRAQKVETTARKRGGKGAKRAGEGAKRMGRGRKGQGRARKGETRARKGETRAMARKGRKGETRARKVIGPYKRAGQLRGTRHSTSNGGRPAGPDRRGSRRCNGDGRDPGRRTKCQIYCRCLNGRAAASPDRQGRPSRLGKTGTKAGNMKQQKP